jgi:hypothetical protein
MDCRTALLVQSGELGSIDSDIRLQTAHSFWTSAPSVPDNSPEFGVTGKNGRTTAGWGKERCCKRGLGIWGTFGLCWCGSQTVGALRMKIVSTTSEQARWAYNLYRFRSQKGNSGLKSSVRPGYIPTSQEQLEMITSEQTRLELKP